MDEFDVDVVIAGAGPSGLMVASELALGGVRAVVLERRGEPALPRAGVLAPRVLEIFDSRGYADEVLARAHELHSNPCATRGIWAGFPGVDYERLDSPYPYFLLLAQLEVERILAERVVKLGGEIRRRVTVTGYSERPHGIEVAAVGADGTGIRIGARYLIGADGARSAVRSAAGIAYPGTEATDTAVNVDAYLEYPWPESPIMVTNNIHGWGLAYPLKDGLTRFGFIDAERRTPKDAPVELESAKRTIERIFQRPFDIKDIAGTARFHNEMRFADRMRAGRVFLVGESVRVHYPASGVGMNFCIQDAFNLGWKLVADVKGRAHPGLLDTYESERRPEIEALLENVKRQTAIQFNYSEDLLALKRFIEKDLIPLEPVNEIIRNELAGLSARYRIEGGAHPAVGRRLRDADLTLGNGSKTRFHALLHGQRFVLLDFSGTTAARPTSVLGPHVDIIDVVPNARQWPGLQDVPAVLVRPDGHVAWVGSADAPQAAMSGLERWIRPR